MINPIDFLAHMSPVKTARLTKFPARLAAKILALQSLALLLACTAARASIEDKTRVTTATRASTPAAANPLIDRLKANGFTCNAKAVGQVCTARANAAVGFKYPMPIAVLVPAAVTQPKQILLYLHGFRGVCPATNATPEQIEADWQLTQQVISGGAADSVILFPTSSGNCATYDSSLVPRFKAFVDWGKNLLQPQTPNLIVAGHSGAGARMANALAANSAIAKVTKSVFLLDATYGMGSTSSPYLDKWAEVVRQNGSVKIFTRYLAGTSTDPGSKNLKRRLPNNVDSAVTVANSHCRVPAVEIKNLLQRRYKSHSTIDLVSF